MAKKKISNNKSAEWNIKIIKIVIIIEIIAIIVVLVISKASAKDFGVIGKVYEIKEKDAIEEIQNRLKLMEESGQIDDHNEIIKQKAVESIKNPKSLNIKRAEVEREYSYDPSIEVKEDLKDARGVVFHKKGTKINPLDMVSMPYALIFFDGLDEDQLQYALDKYNDSETKPKLILTGGSPVKIEKEYGLDVYFDQGGVLVKKLAIGQVPAIVKQEEKVLVIKEVVVQ